MYAFDLRHPQRKKLQGFKSSKRAGQPMGSNDQGTFPSKFPSHVEKCGAVETKHCPYREAYLILVLEMSLASHTID